MIEQNWGRRPCGIRPYPHLLVTPPFALVKPVSGQTRKRPNSVYTALSELRFVSDEGGDTFGPLDSATRPSPLSPISQLHFASPEETMTPTTPIEFSEPSCRESSLPLSSTIFSSPGVREGQARIPPNGRFPPTTRTASLLPQQPGWPMPGIDSPAILVPMRRPLPEVPQHVQSRPLPPRPTKTTVVPYLRDSDRVSHLPREGLAQGSSGGPFATSRCISGSGYDTSVEEDRPETPEDTPPVLYPPAPAINSLPTASLSPAAYSPPPIAAIPIAFPTTPKTNYHAPILLSPTSIDLVTAAGLTITGENGEQFLFGALFRDRKVIVVLIRHFWCLFCQDYVRSISNIVTPGILEKKGVDLVLIGNGAPGMIKAYKRSLKFPFAMYTDPSLQLHDALGLRKTSNQQPGSLRNQAVGRSYVKHNGRWASLRVAVKVAAAKAVHIGNGSESGDLDQLGGEFVFGPGLKSLFVHKMQNSRDHAPIAEVLEAAGVEIREKVVTRAPGFRSPTPTTRTLKVVDIYLTTTRSTSEPSLTPPSTTAVSTTETTRVSTSTDDKIINLALTVPGEPECDPPTPVIENVAEWMARRSNSLMRIKEKREARRRGGIL